MRRNASFPVLSHTTKVFFAIYTKDLTDSFLLPLLIQDRPVNWPRYEPYHSHILHDRAVKAYRSQVQFYREQGKSYDEAQRLALCWRGPCHVDVFPNASTWQGMHN